MCLAPARALILTTPLLVRVVPILYIGYYNMYSTNQIIINIIKLLILHKIDVNIMIANIR